MYWNVVGGGGRMQQRTEIDCIRKEALLEGVQQDKWVNYSFVRYSNTLASVNKLPWPLRVPQCTARHTAWFSRHAIYQCTTRVFQAGTQWPKGVACNNSPLHTNPLIPREVTPPKHNIGGIPTWHATFLLTILTSARDLPSEGEGPPNRP